MGNVLNGNSFLRVGKKVAGLIYWSIGGNFNDLQSQLTLENSTDFVLIIQVEMRGFRISVYNLFI